MADAPLAVIYFLTHSPSIQRFLDFAEIDRYLIIFFRQSVDHVDQSRFPAQVFTQLPEEQSDEQDRKGTLCFEKVEDRFFHGDSPFYHAIPSTSSKATASLTRRLSSQKRAIVAFLWRLPSSTTN